jgi:hypothetical protein
LYLIIEIVELAKLTNERQIQDSKVIELLQKIEELESQIASLTESSGPSKEDIDEAMMLLRLKRETGMTFEYISGIQSIEVDNKALKELRIQFAECVQELEKTKMMLKLQQNINKTSEDKLKKVTDQSRKIQHEYELRIEEYVRLNDIRKHKIEKLQQQLRNIGIQEGIVIIYIVTDIIPESKTEWNGGENCFSIHISGAILSEAMTLTNNSSTEYLTTFCYLDFFEFETEPTPLGIGKKPRYNHTIKYLYN